MKKAIAVVLGTMGCCAVASAATFKVAVEDWGTALSDEASTVALFKALSAKTGDSYEFVKVPAGQALKTVQDGKADFLVAAKTAIKREAKGLAFSIDYLSSDLTVLFKKSVAKNDLGLKGKTICVSSDFEAEQVREYKGKAVRLNHWQEKYPAYEAGKCDAVLGMAIWQNAFLKAHKDDAKAYMHKHPEHSLFDKRVIVTVKEKKGFIAPLNAAFKAMKKDGSLKAYLKEFFKPL